MHLYLRFCDALDRLASALCVLACLALTASVLAIVVMRYGFGIGFIELQDFASYTFAVLLIFSVPVCLRRGGHVRVEVLSENLPPVYTRIADTVAVFLFLVPVFGLIIWADWADLAYSWSIREASVETGGLPGLFLVKTALPLGAAMMILQGIAMVLQPGADRPAEDEPIL